MSNLSSKFNLLWLFLAGILSMFVLLLIIRAFFIISILMLLWVYETSLSKNRKIYLHLGIACFAMAILVLSFIGYSIP